MAVRWGVIGAGGIAFRRTIPEGILKAPDAELVAVMDVAEDRAKEAFEKFGAKNYYLSEEELIKDESVDAVYIATPTFLHRKQVIMAAEHGKHVLCEKPMGMNLKECDDMIAACASNGVKLGLGYMMRFHVYNKKAKDMVAAGEIGEVSLARAQLTCWYPPIPGAWRQVEKLGGGGSFIDMGSHCIDLLEYILDSKVVKVSAFMDTLTHDYEVEDSAVVLLKFENGAHGVVDNNFNVPDQATKNVLEIYGSKGSIRSEGTIGQDSAGIMRCYIQEETTGYNAAQVRTVASGESIIDDLEPVNMYTSQIQSFNEAIEKDSRPMVDGEGGKRNLAIVLAAYEAAKTGKTVNITL
jgi:predicted dehydrogenase